MSFRRFFFFNLVHVPCSSVPLSTLKYTSLLFTRLHLLFRVFSGVQNFQRRCTHHLATSTRLLCRGTGLTYFPCRTKRVDSLLRPSFLLAFSSTRSERVPLFDQDLYHLDRRLRFFRLKNAISIAKIVSFFLSFSDLFPADHAALSYLKLLLLCISFNGSAFGQRKAKELMCVLS